jgi:phosphoserine phosphatase
MIQHPVWTIFNNIIFDCDSTLSTIEGIDELARITGNAQDIAFLTKKAMEGDIPLESVYGRRLKTVNPTQDQVRQIAKIYRDNVVPDAKEVIHALQTLGLNVFIVSGGLIQPILDFGVWLGVPRDQIFAVDMEYDQLAGEWWRYWEQPGGRNSNAQYMVYEANPLAVTGGKKRIVASQVCKVHEGRTMLIGDGGSDLEASPEVDLFVGFGGAVYRKRVADESPLYIHKLSLASILPLALGQLGNTPPFTRLWAEGIQQFHNQDVVFKDANMHKKFIGAMRR